MAVDEGFVPALVEFMLVFPTVVVATEHSHLRGPLGYCSGCSGELRHVQYPCVHVRSAREARERLGWGEGRRYSM
ncbi:hypothetical protein BKA01_004948 [Pseudonocardia eucalypti]|uniref:hypothetical protein n=1 Tax=Pseudonocardia eucalypti TaxID=648755 RepID=UPI001614CD7A|nr:hypothetical protein [Pseudonocardia eucalypti]